MPPPTAPAVEDLTAVSVIVTDATSRFLAGGTSRQTKTSVNYRVKPTSHSSQSFIAHAIGIPLRCA